MTDSLLHISSVLADRYRVERELGAGGMATVYLARDLKHDRDVALKVLRPEFAAVLGAARFLEEIRISARLDHPHILTLIDSGQSDASVWYVLPYVRGESLRQRLIREKQLSIDETIRIASQVASALDYAHRHGVIHRDIKPENILLHEGEAVVADFGIALAVREAGGARLTQSGLSLGTPQYMSPEQATGGHELDARCDVYSLGAVVYEMLAGEPPHTGPTAQAIVAKLLTERPTRIRTVRDTIPERIDTAVGRALAKVPADRYASVADFAAALSTTTPVPVARGRRREVIVGVIGVALVFGAIASLRHRWRPEGAPAREVDIASVAVMPFENLTGNPSDQYLSDGMTEEVIGQLARVPGLKVISRTSMEALKGTRLSIRQIADTLHVKDILEGSVRHPGNRIRVAVDLIDARSDAHIWTNTYESDSTDVFGVQEEIARHVADSLVSKVGGRSTVRRLARPENSAAYEAYLSGRSLMYRRTREGVRGALERFQQAIALDSTYAPAYSGLAAVRFLWVFYDYSGIDFYDAYGRGWVMADRAIALDSDLAEGFAARGYVETRSWAPAALISADFKRALELRPNSADVHQWHSQFLSREGRREEALAEAQRAVSLDPLAPGVRITTTATNLTARGYGIAEDEASRALALEPGLVRAAAFQAFAELLAGNADRCTRLSLGTYVGIRAMCLHSFGKVEEAEHLADSVRRAFAAGVAGDSVRSPVVAARALAEYYAWTGNAAESLAWLERAYTISPNGEDDRVMDSALYDKVRNDPRFKAGLERIHARIYDRVQRAKLGAGSR